MTRQVTFCRYALSAFLHPSQEAPLPRTGSTAYRYTLNLAPGNAEGGWGCRGSVRPVGFQPLLATLPPSWDCGPCDS